ncbi:KTSC domain-containing protein [Pectobacterium versatile]|uniref:KTSC domain-containing protein n=1 Tax=Pectobacterium versatile TaxID=2488639 RepID=UPI000F8D1B60|nr:MULTISPECIES: KTSC domain-containing protein [Pectobacterium]MBA0183017.1 KTSC domain-containing protein [Pectobacterium versatile]MCL6374561.1 KTSC domain-containing protein [Pectobacterium atrosepticum]RUR91468.1 KTSC domain-containing protein [Pectobacterium versatile]
MIREPVTSSNIASIGYEESSLTLEIEFIKSGVYEYSNVPPHVYTELITATSIGVYFNANIKNKYPTTRI